MRARWLHVQATYREAIDPCALYRTPHAITGAAAKRISGMFDELFTHETDDVPSHLFRIGIAYHVLGEALAAAPVNPRANQLVAAAARFGPLTAWLRSNLHRPLGIDDVVEAAKLSRSRLHTLFQQHLGRTPMEHLKELRLAHAARRLLTSGDTIAAVAEAVGFANQFHFSREFARRYGMPPRSYRDDQRLRSGA